MQGSMNQRDDAPRLRSFDETATSLMVRFLGIILDSRGCSLRSVLTPLSVPMFFSQILLIRSTARVPPMKRLLAIYVGVMHV